MIPFEGIPADPDAWKEHLNWVDIDWESGDTGTILVRVSNTKPEFREIFSGCGADVIDIVKKLHLMLEIFKEDQRAKLIAELHGS